MLSPHQGGMLTQGCIPYPSLQKHISEMSDALLEGRCDLRCCWFPIPLLCACLLLVSDLAIFCSLTRQDREQFSSCSLGRAFLTLFTAWQSIPCTNVLEHQWPCCCSMRVMLSSAVILHHWCSHWNQSFFPPDHCLHNSIRARDH